MASFDGKARLPGDYDEVVQFGSSRPRGPIGPVLLACIVLAAILIAVIHHVRQQHPAAPPTAPAAVTTVKVTPGLLGVTSGWELFGLDGTSVVSVQFARGVITRTTLPELQSSGPVSFVVGPDGAIVRPLDNVPGYAIPDGKPARRLTGALAGGGVLLPGPVLADDWFVTSTGTYEQIGPDGQPTGVKVTGIPRLLVPLSAAPDGRGDLLLATDTGAVYDAAPGVLRQVDVTLLAVGSTSWLALACAHGTCHNVVISTTTGARRQLPGPELFDPDNAPLATAAPQVPGLVAPDGSAAVVVLSNVQADVPTKLDLVNLTSGKVRQIGLPVAADTSAQQLAWSPDSQWLFVVTASGQLAVVNPRTGLAQGLHLGLPALSQIAVRPAAR